jgi:hypothetical protein
VRGRTRRRRGGGGEEEEEEDEEDEEDKEDKDDKDDKDDKEDKEDKEDKDEDEGQRLGSGSLQVLETPYIIHGRRRTGRQRHITLCRCNDAAGLRDGGSHTPRHRKCQQQRHRQY